VALHSSPRVSSFGSFSLRFPTEKVLGPVGIFFLSPESGTHYVPQAGLELEIFLPQPPEC
jgi:hypothetical protein